LRALWGDEFASWRYGQQVWQTVIWAMRKGNVKALLTGTPQATPFVKEILRQASVVTKGVTADNEANLSSKFLERVIKPLEGTRLYRQEALAEILEDVDGALWKQAEIDATRVASVPSYQEYDGDELVDVADLVELGVTVDPSASNKGPRSATGHAQRASDECGIMLAGRGSDGHAYVMADWSERLSIEQWAARAIDLYDMFEADWIGAEVNHGHDMVVSALTAHCRATGRSVPKIVRLNASRGKTVRAQPVQGLYVQSMVHHVGVFPKLEDEMTTWIEGAPGARSPNRLDALVYAVSELLRKRSGRKLGYTAS
jgi:phage terminase large subunit-like protein